MTYGLTVTYGSVPVSHYTIIRKGAVGLRVGVGYSDFPGSIAAGTQAAEKAIGMAGNGEPCDIALLFCTARHNQQILRGAVSSVIGISVPIYGGGAVGIITNDGYGYAGDQVGVACLWLEGVTCDVITDGGITENEEAAGFRMGQTLSDMNITPESPVMLFYDAINRDKDGNPRLIMATHILAGIQKALGFMPYLTGAGMQGDHGVSLTRQFIGDGIGDHYAMALRFGGDIRVDTAVIHGCHPASQYYTVTKADGSVILEINNKPALTFMDELLGPSVKTEDYPFFLIFGVNMGQSRYEDDVDQYASRLCFGIDKERGGIVMFEPDMAEGTEFQLMFPSFDLDYMRPKIEAVFDNLNGREPVFAIYIDCAGRCAGYAGTDTEDAIVIQQIVAGRVPVLGLYTGVEIAPVAGRARGLDWSGVFCLFSVSGKDGERNPVLTAHAASNNIAAAELLTSGGREARENIDKLCERNVTEILSLNKQSLAIRYELELKRHGFNLLSELAVSLRQTDRFTDVFTQAARRINAALNMHKTLVLVPDGAGLFTPTVLQGFSVDEQERLMGKAVTVPEELLGGDAVIVTGEDSPERFAQLRGEISVPYFIASPIFLKNKVAAILLTGRLTEQPPFFIRLGYSDFETVHAITDLLGSALVRLHLSDVTLKAETDGLTGLWNRSTFYELVEEYLGSGQDISGAFIMIDTDYFKSVNDVYGHLTGDKVLQACADAMKNVLRDTDIIGRQGGDEFAIFCKGIRGAEVAEKKAAQISASWRKIIPDGSTKPMTASIGIAMSPEHGTTFQELYNNADSALYRAKEQGRNRYVIFEPSEGL